MNSRCCPHVILLLLMVQLGMYGGCLGVTIVLPRSTCYRTISGGSRPGLPGLEHWSDFPSLIAGRSKTGIIKSSHQYLLLMDKANKALSLLVSVFLRITTSKIPGCLLRTQNEVLSNQLSHWGSPVIQSRQSLFSFSITCCIPPEPWSVCNIQRLNYPGSNQISLFCKQF